FRRVLFRSVGTCDYVRSSPKLSAVGRDVVFFCYDEGDAIWFGRFRQMLAPWVGSNAIAIWGSSAVTPGAETQVDAMQALERANVAVLLVSQNFLASEIILEKHLPALLAAARSRALTIVWVLL